jgi:hypothetical protein
MSLININHFVAPFRSKVQIGTVVVLAVLVAVVRFTGIHSSSSNHDSTLTSTSRSPAREVSDRSESAGDEDIGQFLKSNSRSRQALEAREESNGDAQVDNLFKGGPVGGRRPAAIEEDPAAQPGNLNEIKRKLGME